MEKSERVKLIVAQCGSAELFETHDGAFDGVNEIIDVIEDSHSPDPYDPGGRSRNRIYGPSREYASATGFEGLVEYAHVGHITQIYQNGAFLILDRRGGILLDKPGADGKFCPR
jgi:hypothetical protein